MDNLYTEAFAKDGNNLWYSSMLYNKLYCLDLKTGENRFVEMFPKNRCDHIRLHCRAIKHNNKIYFIPDSGGWIHILNLDDKSIEAIEIKHIIGKKRIFDAVEYEDNIYLFANWNGLQIYYFDTNNKICEQIKYTGLDFKGSIMKYPVKNDSKIYIASCGKPQVLIFDCEKKRLAGLEIEECSGGIGTIVYDGESFWSCTKTGFINWNIQGDVIHRVNGFPSDFKTWNIDKDGKVSLVNGYTDKGRQREYPFWFSSILNGKVYFFSRMTNMNVILTTQTGEIKENTIYDEEENEESLLKKRATCNHYFGEKIGDSIYISSSRTGKLYIISSQGIKEFFLVRDKRDKDIWFSEKIGGGFTSIHESEEVGVADLICHINKNDFSNRNEFGDNKGDIIYQFIKESV